MKKKNKKMTIDKLAELTQRGFEALGSEIESKMKSEISGLKGEMKEKFDVVLNNQDHILKRLEDLEADNVMDTAVYRRHEDKLENHEKRIVVVENKILA